MNLFQPQVSSQKIKRQDQGFTLIELLVAIVMSSIIAAALGAGMLAVLNNSKTSVAKTNVKNQLNRAIDYINDDIKRARIAGISKTNVEKDTVILTYFETSDASTHTIKYHLEASNTPWLGPNVLRRQVDGGESQVLVDNLTENVIDSSDFSCSGDATDLNLGGFQACVETATASNGSPIYRTTIALFGEISDSEGERPNSEVLMASTDTISRSVIPNIDPPVLTFTPEDDVTPNLTWDTILGADSYTIYECTTTDLECVPDTSLSTVTATSFADNTDVKGSRSCYYGISNSGGLSSLPGDVICTIVSPTAAPTTGDNSNFVVSDAIQPALTWDRDTENTTEYDIYRCETTDTATGCTVTVGTDTPITTFLTLTDTAFSNNVPWFESETPPPNKAFCYGVVAKNAVNKESATNSSLIDVVKCGALNVPLTIDPAWDVQFISFDQSSIKPAGVTWNTQTGATKYEIYRCATTLATCDPETEGTSILDRATANINPFQYDEVSSPEAGKRHCYAVRAKNETKASEFSATKCGALRPPECTLDLAALGQGSPVSEKTVTNQSDGQAFINIVEGANFTNVTGENSIKAGSLNKLHAVLENSSGVNQNARTTANNANSVILPCNTSITLQWYFDSSALPAPTITIDKTDGGGRKDYQPHISWVDVPTATRYDVHRCETSSTSCAPVFYPQGGFSSSPFEETGNPGNGKRYCYAVQAWRTSPSPIAKSQLSNVECGEPK